MKRIAHAPGGGGDRIGLLAIDACDFFQHALEGGLAGALFVREVGAGEIGLAARGQRTW